MTLPQVIIVLSRCQAAPTQTFGIRLEERTRQDWYATWAFKLPESIATREGYDRTEVAGSFKLDEDEYPGCPNCGQRGIVLCSNCDKIGCWNVAERTHRCPWCGSEGPVQGQITRLRAGGDI